MRGSGHVDLVTQTEEGFTPIIVSCKYTQAKGRASHLHRSKYNIS